MACLVWRASSSQVISTRKHGATSGSSGPPDITCSTSSTASSISRSSISTPRGDDISEFDLRAVVEEVLEEARFLPYADGLELRADLETALQPLRKGYRQGLRQVLTNLVGNGAKFTARGSITVRIVGRPDDAVRVEVQDTGVGIPPSDLERIFLPYEQAERSTHRRSWRHRPGPCDLRRSRKADGRNHRRRELGWCRFAILVRGASASCELAGGSPASGRRAALTEPPRVFPEAPTSERVEPWRRRGR